MIDKGNEEMKETHSILHRIRTGKRWWKKWDKRKRNLFGYIRRREKTMPKMINKMGKEE